MHEAFVVICYDIADNRRRRHVADYLEGWGERVQESVFECHLLPAQLKQVRDAIAVEIDHESDKVRYYSLCGKDRSALRIPGTGRASRAVAYWMA